MPTEKGLQKAMKQHEVLIWKTNMLYQPMQIVQKEAGDQSGLALWTKI